MKIAVPDLISPSYFPAEAAVTLGFFADEGIEAQLELISPIERAYEALRNGDIDIVAGSAHSALSAFPRWKGVKLICAQSQGMYWFLVMRADLRAQRGDLSVVKGRRIGAAPWVGLCLRQLLIESGIDPDRDGVTIMPTPGSLDEKVNFGVAAARALEQGVIDGFWANGMGAEIAVRSGVGTLVLDVRRGDGPKEGFNYTMATLAAYRSVDCGTARENCRRGSRYCSDSVGPSKGCPTRGKRCRKAIPAGFFAYCGTGTARSTVLQIRSYPLVH